LHVIDETEADLRRLIEGDLGPLDQGDDIWETALDWVHYKSRQIPQRPRRVIESIECAKHRSVYGAIDRIANELRTAGDLTPWLSDSIRRRKANPKADLMFNDWQVNHLHLGEVFATPNKVKRSGDLLFVYITDEKAVLIDVQPHGSWTMQSLLRILLQTSPQDMKRHEVKGILGHSNYTADEAYRLRKVGIRVPFELEGLLFFPPGITTSGHTMWLRLYVNALRHAVKTTKEAIESNRLPQNLMSKIATNLSLPVRLGVDIQSGRITLVEKCRQIDATCHHCNDSSKKARGRTSFVRLNSNSGSRP
jgi:hypothetical protein